MKKRILYLDLLKILAMFLVSFYHIGYYFLDYNFVSNVHYIPNLNRIIMNICAVSVPLFFTVSGSIALNKNYTNKQLLHKIFYLFILLIFWSILIKFPRWFLITLIGLYIIYPILKYFFDNNKNIYYLIIAFFLIMPFIYNFIIFLGISFDIKKLNFLTRTGFFTLYSVVYFSLGGVLYNLNKKNPLLCIICFLFGLLLTTLEGYSYTNYNNAMFDNVNASFPTIGALIMCVGIFLFFKNININNINITNLITTISKNCFSVYLFHLPIWSTLNKFLNISFMNLFQCMILTLIVDSIAIIISILIKKIPYLKKTLEF